MDAGGALIAVAGLFACACGETLSFQTVEPRRDVIIDDGGSDRDASVSPPPDVVPPEEAAPPDVQPEVPTDVPVSSCKSDASAIAPEGGAPTGPVNYWPLDLGPVPGAAFDAVGGISGAEVGVLPTTPGQVGLAYRFDGQSYIRFGDVLDQYGYSFSCHLWFRRDAAAGAAGQTLLSKGTTGAGIPPLRGFLLRLRAGGVEWMVNDSGVSVLTVAPEPAPDAWHHVVAVLDRARCELALYVDGALAAEQAFESLDSVETNIRFSIGALDRAPRSPTVGEFFQGELDDVAIFARALDAAEVAELYAKGLSGESLVP